MKFTIVSAVPNLLESPLNHSILKRAQDKGIVELEIVNLHDFGRGIHKQIDDYQYGGGAGMLIMADILKLCLDSLQEKQKFDEIIFLTPDGETYKQSTANTLSLKGNILLICGHYKGIDERFREKYVTKEISVGDYVLSGGELGACIIVDSVARLIPGVLSNETSALTDSFQDNLLAPPVYTRPDEWEGMKVPDVLLSGNFKKIDEWRAEQAYQRTKTRRPDLLD
ncbi:MAG: tRNA (guanine37-N1)-methyltransferase [Planctomycetota bacterium]|jgi:tRNA (guanine37-N1)-methyltransferase